MVLFSWIYKPLEYLPLGKYVRVSMIIFSLWGYALLTGGSPSVIRAVTMFSLFSIGNYINRSPPTIYLVILSFGTLVFINPLYLKQLGFQMSYLAVFGILCLYPLFMKLLQVKKGLLHRFWSMTAVTLSAQIAVAPITIYYFHQFPVKTISFEALKSHYVLEDKNLIIVDGNWSRNLKLKNKKLSLVLRNNTQVNLERLLQRNKIVEVIADASSYSNIKRRWEKTCDNYKVFFYDTQKKGPYLFASKSRNKTF